jgi:hypothetical protein
MTTLSFFLTILILCTMQDETMRHALCSDELEERDEEADINNDDLECLSYYPNSVHQDVTYSVLSLDEEEQGGENRT